MKKIILISAFLFISSFSFSQMYTGFNANYVFSPTSSEIDGGLGLNVLLGYSFQKRLDIDLSYNNLWISSMISDNYQINHLTTRVKYSFLIKKVRPYLGIGIGYFQKKFDMPFNDSYNEKGLGINPSIGIIFNSNIMQNMFFNTKISYYKIFTAHAINIFSVNFGLLYYFDKQVK